MLVLDSVMITSKLVTTVLNRPTTVALNTRLPLEGSRLGFQWYKCCRLK